MTSVEAHCRARELPRDLSPNVSVRCLPPSYAAENCCRQLTERREVALNFVAKRERRSASTTNPAFAPNFPNTLARGGPGFRACGRFHKWSMKVVKVNPAPSGPYVYGYSTRTDPLLQECAKEQKTCENNNRDPSARKMPKKSSAFMLRGGSPTFAPW